MNLDENDPIKTDWSKLRFADLAAEFQREDSSPCDKQYPLRVRCENILTFVGSDRLWPPDERVKAKIIPALKEVLARLPDDEFYVVDGEVTIILLDRDLLALNVPPLHSAAQQLFTIIFSEHCWELSLDALVGLVAHELAHTFNIGTDYRTDEAATDAKARSWGFEHELDCLNSEMKQRLSTAL